MKAGESGKTYFRPFLIGAIIFTVLVLHFTVSQFISFESAEDSAVSNLIKRQPTKMQPETRIIKNETSVKPEVVNMKETVSSKENIEAKAVPKIEIRQTIEDEQSPVKKKDSRESRAERLRRAEKILTGV